jgi:uncharacterized protein (TIGR02466 family)
MQLASLFWTPVAMHEHPGLESMNKEITDILVAESESIPSVAVSNVGGWHSKYDLMTRPEACFQKLGELIIASARETTAAVAKSGGGRALQVTAKADMWAMVMRNGDYTVPHAHADCHWASVYYADAGDAGDAADPKSGRIAFVDPRLGYLPIPGLEMVLANFEVNPKTGQLLLFPGWLMHYVHAYRGKRPRVSLSCNVTFEVVGS